MNTLINNIDPNVLATIVIVTGVLSIAGLLHWIFSDDF